MTEIIRTGPSPISQNAATIPAATTMQNAAVANGNGTSLPVTGYAIAILNIVSSPAMSGGTTVNFEASVDNTTWVSIMAHQMGVSGALAVSTTVDGDYRITVAGYTSVRARISAYSAGTVTVKGYVTPLAGHPTTVAAAPAQVSSAQNITAATNYQVACANMGTATIQILGTSGTVGGTWEGSVDGGVTWALWNVLKKVVTPVVSTVTGTLTVGASGNVYVASVAGLTHFRFRCTTYSGSPVGWVMTTMLSTAPRDEPAFAVLVSPSTTQVTQNNAANLVGRVEGTKAYGTAVTQPVQVGGSDGTNVAFLYILTKGYSAGAIPGGAVVQEWKDCGRTSVAFMADSIAGTGADALAAYDGFLGATALAAASTTGYTVTAAKLFRLQTVTLAVKGTAADTIKIKIRFDAAVDNTKAYVVAANVCLLANTVQNIVVPVPDDCEIAAGMQVAISINAAATSTVSVSVTGFEF